MASPSRSRLAAPVALLLLALAIGGVVLVLLGGDPSARPARHELAPVGTPARASATDTTAGTAPSAHVDPAADPAPVASHVLVVVRDLAGDPVEGAWVAAVMDRPPAPDEIGDLGLRPSWRGGGHPTTDAAGRAVVPVPAGARSIVAYASRGALEGVSGPSPVERWRVEVVIAPPDPPPPGLGALRLRLRADGGPYVSAPVELGLSRQALDADGRYGWREVGRGRVVGTTDGEGTLSIGRLPTGAYTLRVAAAGWAELQASVVIEAVTSELDLELCQRGCRVSGRLAPPREVDARDVRVRVLGPLGAIAGRTEAGAWSVEGLPPGEFLIVAEVAGHLPRWAPLAVVAGPLVQPGPALDWSGATRIRGRLLLGDGRPSPRHRVWATPESVTQEVLLPGRPFVNRIDQPWRPLATAERRGEGRREYVPLRVEGWTDAAGRFELRGLDQARAYTLHADDGRRRSVGALAVQRLEPVGDTDVGDLTVDDPAGVPDAERFVFAGTVTTPDAGLGAVEATLVDDDGAPVARDQVDPRSGAFRLEVRADRYERFSLRACGVDGAGRPVFSEPRRLWAQPGRTEEPTLELRLASRLRGAVRRPAALAGRELELMLLGDGWSGEARVDAAGAWALDVPAGAELELFLPGLHDAVIVPPLAPGAERELAVDLGPRPVLLAVTLEGAPALEAHARATVVFSGGEVAAPLHRGVGVVPGLPVGPATLEVEVEEPSTGTFWTVRRSLTLEVGQPPERLSLHLPRGRLRGAVAPIPQARVRLVEARCEAGPVHRAEVVVQESGAFLLDLPAGAWEVGLAQDGLAQPPTVSAVVQPDAVTEVTLPPTPASR